MLPAAGRRGPSPNTGGPTRCTARPPRGTLAGRLVMVPALHPAPVQTGDVIRGKYRVERLLGQGGMAYVISAWHLHLQQRVAIKLLRPETVEHAEVVERFLREARAASRLESAGRVAARPRRGRAGDGGPVHRDGVPGGPGSLPGAPRPRPGASPRGRRLGARGVQRRGRGARAGRHPPRSQAGQPLPRPEAQRRAGGQGARLRHLDAAPGHAHHPGRGGDGIRRVHVARADAIRRRRRRPRRHLVARHHALRAHHRQDPVPRRRRGPGGRGRPHQSAGAASHPPPRSPPRLRGRRPPLPGEGPRRRDRFASAAALAAARARALRRSRRGVPLAPGRPQVIALLASATASAPPSPPRSHVGSRVGAGAVTRVVAPRVVAVARVVGVGVVAGALAAREAPRGPPARERAPG